MDEQIKMDNDYAKKIKDLDDAIKDVDRKLKKAKQKGEALQGTLKSKKKALKQIKKEKFKKKNIGAKEATNFLKDFSRGKK